MNDESMHNVVTATGQLLENVILNHVTGDEVRTNLSAHD